MDKSKINEEYRIDNDKDLVYTDDVTERNLQYSAEENIYELEPKHIDHTLTTIRPRSNQNEVRKNTATASLTISRESERIKVQMETAASVRHKSLQDIAQKNNTTHISTTLRNKPDRIEIKSRNPATDGPQSTRNRAQKVGSTVTVQNQPAKSEALTKKSAAGTRQLITESNNFLSRSAQFSPTTSTEDYATTVTNAEPWTEDAAPIPTVTSKPSSSFATALLKTELTQKITNPAFVRTQKQNGLNEDEPLGAMLRQQLNELRDRNRVAFENSMRKRRYHKGNDVHLLWSLFILPFTALLAYILFVVVRRRKYYAAKANSAKAQGPSRSEHKKLSSAELRKKNWIRKKRPMPPMYDKFDAEKFVDKGPLVLTKELQGDVKFIEGLPSKEIVQVQFDEGLNEVVEIGSGIEVLTEETAATTSKRTAVTPKAPKGTYYKGKSKARSLEFTQSRSEKELKNIAGKGKSGTHPDHGNDMGAAFVKITDVQLAHTAEDSEKRSSTPPESDRKALTPRLPRRNITMH